eukprot:373698_1
MNLIWLIIIFITTSINANGNNNANIHHSRKATTIQHTQNYQIASSQNIHHSNNKSLNNTATYTDTDSTATISEIYHSQNAVISEVSQQQQYHRNLLSIFDCNWTTGTTKLPRIDNKYAIGHYNNTIFLIGGQSNPYQLVEYDIMQNQFSDKGLIAISDSTAGAGQFYTQINNAIYMIDSSGNHLSRYDMKNKLFENQWSNIIFETNVGFKGCLSSANGYMFVVGGEGSQNVFQVLNLSTNTWMENAPPMNTARKSFSCIANPTTNELYAIGGWTGGTIPRDRIEKIYIGNNIEQQNWIYIDNLLIPVSISRSILIKHTNEILVVGGSYQTGLKLAKRMQLINCTAGKVSYGGFLSSKVKLTSAIIVNNVAYAFGGKDITELDTWQYYYLPPTTEPTSCPTTPTTNPTSNPTLYPTLSPTNNPTISPTNNPTISPSNNPTISPTNNPTISPTNNPT